MGSVKKLAAAGLGYMRGLVAIECHRSTFDLQLNRETLVFSIAPCTPHRLCLS